MNKIEKRRGGFYFLDDKPYVSVTQVLNILAKPQLRYWYGRQVYRALCKNPTLSEQEALNAPYKASKKALDIGSTVHSIVESYKEVGKKLDVVDGLQLYANAFYDWVEMVKPKILVNEKTVVSEKYKYAGTFDILAEIEGKNYLIDVKTGKDLYPQIELQLSAYKQGMEESGNGVDEIAGLLLEKGKDGKPTGKFKFQTFNNKFVEFLAAKRLWEWNNADLLVDVGYKK